MFFFFIDRSITESYTLSLHDALSISAPAPRPGSPRGPVPGRSARCRRRDRKSTRLNSSHGYISYAVFRLKKKNNNAATPQQELRQAQRIQTKPTTIHY